MPEEKLWDVVSLLKTSADHFKARGVNDARLNVELLLSHVLALKRFDLYLNFDRPVSPSELETFRSLVRRRLKGEPLQYITGEQEFFGLKFKVDRRVLIPRPETEQLVEIVIEEVGKKPTELRILDIGTGSGSIAIALAKTIQKCTISAVDISSDAILLASENAANNNVLNKITFIEADALNEDFALRFEHPFHVVISNPPYIPIDEKESVQLEVKNFEPETALFTETGFEFYNKIAADAKFLLEAGGFIAFELHASGADKVISILSKNGFTNIQVKKDYAGFNRFIIATKALIE